MSQENIENYATFLSERELTLNINGPPALFKWSINGKSKPL